MVIKSLFSISFITLFFQMADPCFGEPGKGKDDFVRAVMQFKKPGSDSLFFADLLEGIDFSKPHGPYTDPKHALKLGIFAERLADGTNKSLRYNVETLYPDQSYVKGSPRQVVKGLWLEDLKKIFQKKYKVCKNERDIQLKRRKLGRLLNWCNANYLFKEVDKIEKELNKAEKPTREEKDALFAEPEDEVLDNSEEHNRIIKGLQALPDVGEGILVRSSRHITIATDYLPEKTVLELLDLGERVIKDFKVFMYDSSLEKSKPIPSEEILRVIHLERLDTFDAALRNASTLSYCANLTKEEDIKRCTSMGGRIFGRYRKGKMLRTTITCNQQGNVADPDGIKDRNRDLNDHVAHHLGHTLLTNRLRPVPGGQMAVMPWLSEGMAVYMSIKHLGSKRSACVDFRTEKKGGTRSAPTKKKKKAKFQPWEHDVETMVINSALDDSADPFMTMIQIPAIHRLKPETLAKAFSMIDFLLESDRVGFLMFVEKLQKHCRYLYKKDGLKKFYAGMDELIATCFSGAVIKVRRKTVKLDSIKALEEAWRHWASNYVLEKK